MHSQFGSYGYGNLLVNLRNLKQVSSMQNYIDALKELYLRARIREDQTLSFFLSRLLDSLRMLVRMFKPKTLTKLIVWPSYKR